MHSRVPRALSIAFVLVLPACSSESESARGMRRGCEMGDPFSCAIYSAERDAVGRRAEGDAAFVQSCRLGADPAVRRRPRGSNGNYYANECPGSIADSSCMQILEPERYQHGSGHEIVPPPFDRAEMLAIERRVCLDAVYIGPDCKPAVDDMSLCACDRLEAHARSAGDTATAAAAAAAFPGQERPGCRVDH